jgi:HSP20 family protein
VPGVDPKDISITLTGDVLTIEGKLGEKTFSRSILLPYDVQSDQVKAKTEHGILRITLPRTEASKPRKIVVENAA